MPTNLAIDDDLLKKAQQIGHHQTKRETVNAALQEYIRMHQRREILGLAGTLDWDPDYDHKAMRRRR